MATSTIKQSAAITVSSGVYEATHIEANTSGTVKNITLQPGTWLVLSYLQLSESGSGIYNHTLFCDGIWSSTVRSTEINGGGSVNYATISVSEGNTKVVSVSAYAQITCNAYGLYTLIKLR